MISISRAAGYPFWVVRSGVRTIYAVTGYRISGAWWGSWVRYAIKNSYLYEVWRQWEEVFVRASREAKKNLRHAFLASRKSAAPKGAIFAQTTSCNVLGIVFIPCTTDSSSHPLISQLFIHRTYKILTRFEMRKTAGTAVTQPVRYAWEEILFPIMPTVLLLLCWKFSLWYFPLHFIISFLTYWMARVRQKTTFWQFHYFSHEICSLVGQQPEKP